MTRTTTPGSGAYNTITRLMAEQPTTAKNYRSQREFTEARVGWLFAMADALEDADLAEDAQTVRESALDVIRDAAGRVAAGEPPAAAVEAVIPCWTT